MRSDLSVLCCPLVVLPQQSTSLPQKSGESGTQLIPHHHHLVLRTFPESLSALLAFKPRSSPAESHFHPNPDFVAFALQEAAFSSLTCLPYHCVSAGQMGMRSTHTVSSPSGEAQPLRSGSQCIHDSVFALCMEI